MKHSIEVLQGTNTEKPKLLLISGMHGNESNAVLTTMLLKKFMKNNIDYWFEKYYSITFLIGVNEYGLKYDTRNNGSEYNTDDLNRLFFEPENYKQILKDEMDKADIVIDVHNSPNIENCVLITFDDYCKSYYDFITIKNGIPSIVWNIQSPTTKNYVNSIENKKGFTIELNNMGVCSPKELDKNIDFVYRVIDCIDECPKVKENRMQYKDLIYTKVKNIMEGMLRSEVKCGDTVIKGKTLGIIVDYDNNVLEEIVSPIDGKIMTMSGSYFMVEDSELYSIMKD